MSSASWSPGKAGGVIPSKSEGRRARGAHGVRTRPNLKAREPGAKMSGAGGEVPAQAERTHSPFLHFLFYSGSQRIGWGSPTLGRVVLTQPTDSSDNVFRKRPPRPTQK